MNIQIHSKNCIATEYIKIIWRFITLPLRKFLFLTLIISLSNISDLYPKPIYTIIAKSYGYTLSCRGTARVNILAKSNPPPGETDLTWKKWNSARENHWYIDTFPVLYEFLSYFPFQFKFKLFLHNFIQNSKKNSAHRAICRFFAHFCVRLEKFPALRAILKMPWRCLPML